MFLFISAAALFLCSCNQENLTTQLSAEASSITKNYINEKCEVRYTLNKTTISVAEQINLYLDAVMPEGYEAEFPEQASISSDFTVFDGQRTAPALIADNRIRIRQSFQLEPFLAGEYTIQPLKIIFHAKEKKDAVPPTTVTTDKEIITVTSLLPKDENRPQLRDIMPPVVQPLDIAGYAPLFGAALILLLLGGAAFYWFRQRKKNGGINTAPPPLPSHLLAFQELDDLLAGDLLGRGEYKLFHAQVSDILRRYIEPRFSIRAPERTTEEFLCELGRTNLLATNHKLLLRNFLTHCDLVKFAEHRPTDTETNQTIELCRQFIKETAPKPEVQENSNSRQEGRK